MKMNIKDEDTQILINHYIGKALNTKVTIKPDRTEIYIIATSGNVTQVSIYHNSGDVTVL